MRVASETYDYEPFDHNSTHSMQEVADAIRHKGYGKDVREAIAQGFENLDKHLGSIEKQIEDQKNQKDTLDNLFK